MKNTLAKKLGLKINLLSLTIFLVFVFIIFEHINVSSFLNKISIYFKIQSLCKDCNVVVVALDSLSANHMPCYGYDRNTSPNLCSLAKDNILFVNAYANSHWTMPTDLSLFTGLYPSTMNVINYSDKLDSKIKLFPQILKDFGYSAYFSAPKDDIAFPMQGVYDRLGDSFYNQPTYSWNNMVEMFKKSVRSGKKTFLFLHSYDNHSPYLIGNRKQIYGPIDSTFPTSESDFSDNFAVTPKIVNLVLQDADIGIGAHVLWLRNKDQTEYFLNELKKAKPDYQKEFAIVEKMRLAGLLSDFSPGELRYKEIDQTKNKSDIEVLKALYDQTINIMDEGRIPLITSLINDQEFKNNTILIIYSEHGEEFMEHGNLTHDTIYNSDIKIPLIIHIPNISNKRISDPIQLADIAPTLYELIGKRVNLKFDGKSLVPLILGVKKQNDFIQVDGGNFGVKALIYDKWKLFLSRQTDGEYLPYEMYDLSKDPEEQNNVLFAFDNIKNSMLRLYHLQASKN